MDVLEEVLDEVLSLESLLADIAEATDVEELDAVLEDLSDPSPAVACVVRAVREQKKLEHLAMYRP